MSGESYNFSKMTLLIVDGSHFMRGLIAGMCRNFGFRFIYEASDGATGFQLFKEQKINIVLTSWEMEPVGGIEFISTIRYSPESSDRFVPAIMLTSHSQANRVEQARDVGASEFLGKPISADTLLTRIMHTVDRPRSFIRCDSFFGPDRRRHDGALYTGEERRVNPDGAAIMSPAEMAAGEDPESGENAGPDETAGPTPVDVTGDGAAAAAQVREAAQ